MEDRGGSQQLMSDKRDVTGVWYGRYDAAYRTEENGFIAVLEEMAGAVSGVITEPDTSGKVEVRRALVAGSRDGAMVRWVKQYDGTGGHVHAINYAGQINTEGTEIVGGWTQLWGTGRFVMEREKFDAAELEAEAEVELDEPVLR
jgi:hypothetical protein